MSIVCRQVEVSARGWSLLQRNPTECGVSECDLKTSRIRRLGCSASQKNKEFFISFPIAKLMHDTEYLAITYWKSVHNYIGEREGSIFHVHRSDGLNILIWLYSSGRGLVRSGRLTQKMLSNEGLLICCGDIILLSFDTDQKLATIDW